MGERDHRRGHRERAADCGHAFTDDEREVAGQRSGDGERERPCDQQQAGVRLVVVELVLQKERCDDEAPHVREVRAELRGNGKGEIPSSEVGERQQRMVAPPFDRHEGHAHRDCERDADEHEGARPTGDRALVDGQQQRQGADAQ